MEDWRVRLIELRELRQASIAELKVLLEMPKGEVDDLIAANRLRVKNLSAEIGGLLDQAKELADAA